MSFSTRPTSLSLDRQAGLDGGWAVPFDGPGLRNAVDAVDAGTAPLRGEVESEARGLDVAAHAARIVGHLLAPGGTDGL